MVMSQATWLLALTCLTVSGFPGIPPAEEEGETSTSSSDPGDREQGNVRVVQLTPDAFRESLLFRSIRAGLSSPLGGLPAAAHWEAPDSPFRPPFFIPNRAAVPSQALRSASLFRSPMQARPRAEELLEEKNTPAVWQRVIQKANRAGTVLPLSRSEVSKSSCKAILFTQTISRASCIPVKIQNHFCFGQCSSFYVPGTLTGAARPCSGCAPSRVSKMAVPLQCGNELLAQEEEVTLVEECQCEAQGEKDTLHQISTLSFQG